jgi:hypothetical protein
MAGSYSRWLCDTAQVGINNLKTAVIAGADLIDQLTDMLDALPVVGPLINNGIDLVSDMATRGDYDDLAALVNDQYAREYVQCFAYCWLKDNVPENTSITFDQCEALGNALQANLFVQPPRGPLLTIWGQALAVFAGGADGRITAFRLAIAEDERSNDCSILCANCPDEVVDCSGLVADLATRLGTTFTVDPENGCLLHMASGPVQGDGDYYIAITTNDYGSQNFSVVASNDSGLSLVSNGIYVVVNGTGMYLNSLTALSGVSAMDYVYIRSNTPFTLDLELTEEN